MNRAKKKEEEIKTHKTQDMRNSRFKAMLRGLTISDGVPVSTRSDTGAGAGFVSGAAIRVRVRDLFFRTIFFLNE